MCVPCFVPSFPNPLWVTFGRSSSSARFFQSRKASQDSIRNAAQQKTPAETERDFPIATLCDTVGPFVTQKRKWPEPKHPRASMAPTRPKAEAQPNRSVHCRGRGGRRLCNGWRQYNNHPPPTLEDGGAVQSVGAGHIVGVAPTCCWRGAGEGRCQGPPRDGQGGRRDGAVLGEATRPPTHKDRLGRRGWRQRKRYKPTNRIALASATTSGGTASKGMQQRGSLRRANGQLASRCAADGTAGEGGPSHGRRAQLGSRWGRTNGTAAPTQPPPPIPCEALMPSAALRPPAERRAAAAHSANRRAIGLTPPPPPLGDQPRNSAQDVFSAASLIW